MSDMCGKTQHSEKLQGATDHWTPLRTVDDHVTLYIGATNQSLLVRKNCRDGNIVLYI